MHEVTAPFQHFSCLDNRFTLNKHMRLRDQLMTFVVPIAFMDATSAAKYSHFSCFCSAADD